jgi:hypothetical protein
MASVQCSWKKGGNSVNGSG